MKNVLRNSFGLDFKMNQIQPPKGLPFYMTNNRKFYELISDTISFIAVELSYEDKFGVVALEKQLAKYISISGMNIVYWFPMVNKVQRDALVERKIPFICLPNQIYLPFLGIALTNQFKKEKILNVDKMTPAAQSLFLHFLYNVKAGTILKKEAAAALGLTRTSITRASEQLVAMGLISEKAYGKELRMSATAIGREYYELARQHLINPVQRVVTVAGNAALQKFPLSGESALSNRSMLNAPKMPVIAICKADPMLKELSVVDEKWEPDSDLLQVEIWKYNPLLFENDEMVDPVSMSLSLQDCMDERVQGELEEYMEGLEW